MLTSSGIPTELRADDHAPIIVGSTLSTNFASGVSVHGLADNASHVSKNTSDIADTLLESSFTPADHNQFSHGYADAVVVVAPRIADCRQLLEAARRRNVCVSAVIPNPGNSAEMEGTNMGDYYPTADSLLHIGVQDVYEPPAGEEFDVCHCAKYLARVQEQRRWRFRGVIPLREAAVEYSDILANQIGLATHNDLSLALARRDKGLMKHAVAAAGLRIAKFARLTAEDGSDVRPAVESLQLSFPVVVKTPCGFSTMDVYICESLQDAEAKARSIIGHKGVTGKDVHCALIEEFLGGDEFAVNLIASPYLCRGGLQSHNVACNRDNTVTDIWKYTKTHTNGTMRNKWQQMVDPHDGKYSALVQYASHVARAVGISYGIAHVELKAHYCPIRQEYVDPVMIEVGARLPGGRKAIMAQSTIPGWVPFAAMLDAHCGYPVRLPRSFSPVLAARHVFVPSEKTGTLICVRGDNFERLATYHSHMMLRQAGDDVVKATDIMSFVGFLWLVGPLEQVEADAVHALDNFSVEVKEEREKI